MNFWPCTQECVRTLKLKEEKKSKKKKNEEEEEDDEEDGTEVEQCAS